ncbi:MAG: carboxypeptidase-like regulatory domain-containing protein [Acidobacteriia bacterium]|nr:carboxypeptidase-like regulatory domain-containing protein [Terriglobia bacterium]
MKRVEQVMFFLVAFLLSVTSAFPQASSTSLRGSVTDPSGSVVTGATVVLANAESKTERTATTGPQGEYQFLFVPPGTYILTVSASGFARYQQTGLQLLVNTPVTANLQLKVGATNESVTVTSEAPALNLVDASIGNSFDQVQVTQIPLDARNVPDLLSLQAGVAYTGDRPDIDKDQDTRNGAVNGARSDQSNITLDGVDVNDQSSGYAFTSVLPTTLDSVQEFRVTTSNYNADQGTGSGAQVSLVTKSGTNSWHGSAYEYHRNTVTSANDYFVKGAEVGSGQPNVPDKLIRNIFGVSVGGPIQKNRLFFFANYEGTRQREEQSTVRTIPTPTLCAGQLRYNDVSGGVTTLTPTDIANLDPLQSGYNGQGPGINQAILNATHTGYFDKTFCTGQFATNDTSVGDGLNYSGYRFRAPVSLNNNAFIARLDYHLTADGRQNIFWRGALQNLNNPQAPFLPGSPPEQTVTDHSKGFVVGYTVVLNPTMVNTFHWGFTRQSTGFQGNANQEWNVFYGLDQGIVYSHNAQTPVHNLIDDFSWTKGKHTLQMGTNIGFVRNPRVSYEHSFNIGKGATNWMSPTGFANTAQHDPNNPQFCFAGGSPLDPCHATDPNTGLPFPEPTSTPQFDYPILGLLGMVSDIVGNYNYDKSGNPLGSGTPVQRKYGLNWYEFYGQDSWRVKPNLTITYGLRWSLFPPPWEVNGFQASPTCDPTVNGGVCPSWAYNLGTEFAHNAQAQKQGIGYDATPLVSFILGGPGNPGPGFYQFEKSDFSPRVSFAYSPRASGGWMRKMFGDSDKTVIRGGFSKVYDRPGMQLLSTFDANAPGGLSATVQNPCCSATLPTGIPGPSPSDPYDTADGVPRITNINQIPATNSFGDQFLTPAPPGQFPQTPPSSGQAITWGIDQSLKTPYAYAFDFSVGRELPRNFSLQLSYVGRLGRNLLTQRDLRQPIDIVDPKTGIDYFSAATALAKVAMAQLARPAPNNVIDPTQVTNNSVGKTYQFWQDLIPALPNNSLSYQSLYTGFTATPGPNGLIQAIYDLYYDPSLSYLGNEVVGLGYTDIYYGLTDSSGSGAAYGFKGPACTDPLGVGFCPGTSLNNQATSMFAWSSIGKSNYNALQATLRKQFGHGVQFDLNYTYSKSIDFTSAATRLGFSSSVNVGAPGSRLANGFSPDSRRGVSDFDTTHQINANWIADLPFGKGRHFAGGAGSVTDAFIGGWQLSGVARWTSGLPFSVDNGNFWATNWDEQGIAQQLSGVKTGAFKQPDGSVSVFANPAAAFASFQHPFPGQSGSRNVVRGDGYAGLDMALNKRWKLPMEGHSLQFRWEVFNVPNLHRFNVLSGLGTQACACIASLQQLPQSFGSYTGLLTQPRVMQFALRYEF